MIDDIIKNTPIITNAAFWKNMVYNPNKIIPVASIMFVINSVL